jgi:hypothetical protein
MDSPDPTNLVDFRHFPIVVGTAAAYKRPNKANDNGSNRDCGETGIGPEVPP